MIIKCCTKKWDELAKAKKQLAKSEEIGRMLNHMVENPEKYKPRGK